MNITGLVLDAVKDACACTWQINIRCFRAADDYLFVSDVVSKIIKEEWRRKSSPKQPMETHFMFSTVEWRTGWCYVFFAILRLLRHWNLKKEFLRQQYGVTVIGTGFLQQRQKFPSIAYVVLNINIFCFSSRTIEAKLISSTVWKKMRRRSSLIKSFKLKEFYAVADAFERCIWRDVKGTITALIIPHIIKE